MATSRLLHILQVGLIGAVAAVFVWYFSHVGVRSVTVQGIHYFARPHSDIRRTPIHGRAAWRASDLREEEWRHYLSAEEIASCESAVSRWMKSGRALSTMQASDVPELNWLQRYRAEVDPEQGGRGFVVLSGVPVKNWSVNESSAFFWALGLTLGIPGAQNGAGDLLGNVKVYGDKDDKIGAVRQYKTAEAITFHCDLADVVGLLCLNPGTSGGESRLASSVTIYNEMLKRHPQLVDQLYEPLALDTRGDGGIDWFHIRPCKHHNGTLRTFWHSEYFTTSARHADAPQPNSELIAAYDEIANQPEVRLDMALHAGDVQLVSNHQIVHARTSFTGERHLLRLWISLPNSNTDRSLMDIGEVVGSFVQAKLRAWRRRFIGFLSS